MPEAVTVSSLMMMTLIVSEESIARDTQTDRETDRHTQTWGRLSKTPMEIAHLEKFCFYLWMHTLA